MGARFAARLAVDGLVVDRGERRVLAGVSLALASAEAMELRGPNGAGKSTLLRTLAGLIVPIAGDVALEGVEGAAAQNCHLVGHQNAIKLEQTAFANLRFFHAFLGGGGDADEAVETALDAVGLLMLADTPARFLSQGQRRRLALARLTVAPRALWLLDEPTAGLDGASRRAFRSLVEAHREAGGMVLAATHEPLGLASPRMLELTR